MAELSTPALRAAEEYRLANGYRPFLLTLHVHIEADGGCWEPPSKVDVMRKLTRPRDEIECTYRELDDAVAIAVVQGLLDGSSTAERMVLAGNRADSVEVAA